MIHDFIELTARGEPFRLVWKKIVNLFIYFFWVDNGSILDELAALANSICSYLFHDMVFHLKEQTL